MKLTGAIAALLLVLTTTSVWAREILVPEDYATIQEAISAAPAGAKIRVGPGHYRENLVIEKPLSLMARHGAGVTVLDGRQRSTVVWVRGTGRERVNVSGFTITNGSNIFTNEVSATPGSGGGVRVESARVEITDSIIRGNVSCLGAGIFSQTATIEVRRNRIVQNVQDPSCFGANGGGVYLNGGAAGESVIADNLIAGHRIGGYGGGIGVNAVQDVTITRNLIKDNVAADYGGGLYLGGSSAEVSKNVFDGNSTAPNGSGAAMAVFAVDPANKVRISENMVKATLSDFGSVVLLLSYYDHAVRFNGNAVFGSGSGSLVRCEALPVKVTRTNVLVNSGGPDLGGTCIR